MSSLKSRIARLLPQTAVMHLQALDHYFNGEPELRLLRHLVAPGRIAIDAGANIGVYSYFLRRYASNVFAYEPNHELAVRLRRVLPGVEVREIALSDRRGVIQFEIPVDSSGRLSHELGSVAQHFLGNVVRRTVDCTTIDVEASGDVGFIKIDVEQHEREVLRGAIITINKCRPVILVEVYPLKYESPLPEEFAFILKDHYCGWFSFSGQWFPFETFRSVIHAAPENFGYAGKFMGNNVVLFPSEHPRATIGPT